MSNVKKQDEELNEVEVINGSGKVQKYSYQDLKDLEVPEDEEEQAQYIKRMSKVVSAKTVFSNWVIGKCADKRAEQNFDGEEETITESLENLAAECEMSKRSIQYCRTLYKSFNTEEGLDELYKFVDSGVTWTNFMEIMFPLDDSDFDEFRLWLISEIDENGKAPDVQSMRDKAAELKQSGQNQNQNQKSQNSGKSSVKSPEDEQISSNVNTIDNAQNTLRQLGDKWEQKVSAVLTAVEDLENEQLKEEILDKYNDALVDFQIQLERLARIMVNTQVGLVNKTNRNRKQLAESATDLLDSFEGEVYLVETSDEEGNSEIKFVSSNNEKDNANTQESEETTEQAQGESE